MVKASRQDAPLAANEDPSSTSFKVSFAPEATSPAVYTNATGFGSFVATRSGAYCYLPSMTALRYLAATS